MLPPPRHGLWRDASPRATPSFALALATSFGAQVCGVEWYLQVRCCSTSSTESGPIQFLCQRGIPGSGIQAVPPIHFLTVTSRNGHHHEHDSWRRRRRGRWISLYSTCKSTFYSTTTTTCCALLPQCSSSPSSLSFLLAPPPPPPLPPRPPSSSTACRGAFF